MAKRTSKKATPRKQSAKKQKEGSPPPPHFSEQIMRDIFGSGGDQSFDAQQFAYNALEAMDAEDWEHAQQCAMQALKLDPNCVDALHVLSRLGSESDEELIDNLRRTVERGERALGKKFFKENTGWFWGLIETRPYMRTRAHLASLLHEAGKIGEAIEHFEALLRLNPNDNQGLRYGLLGCYLEMKDLKGAERLFSEYPDEGSAMFAWSRVLACLLSDDKRGAATALAEARAANKHVEAYLVGRKKTPGEGPGYYSPGEPSEAIVCMHEIGTAWTMHPTALEWLKQQKSKRK